jgi:hypothetical protein
LLRTPFCESSCTQKVAIPCASRVASIMLLPLQYLSIHLSHYPVYVSLQWRRYVSILPHTPDFADSVSCFLFFHVQPWARVSCTIRQTALVNLPKDFPMSQLNFKLPSMDLLALNNAKGYSTWVEWRAINFNTSKTTEPAAITKIATCIVRHFLFSDVTSATGLFRVKYVKNDHLCSESSHEQHHTQCYQSSSALSGTQSVVTEHKTNSCFRQNEINANQKTYFEV